MSDTFEAVNLKVAANVYFDGKVTSRTATFADGTEKTLGVMQVGDYEFGTAKPELMEVTAGKVEVLLPGETEWQAFAAGESFNVPGEAKFQLKVHELFDYVCSYLDA